MIGFRGAIKNNIKKQTKAIKTEEDDSLDEIKITQNIAINNNSIIKKNENKNIKVVPGPCMGRCDVAPTVCVGKNYVDKASLKTVEEALKNKNFP